MNIFIGILHISLSIASWFIIGFLGLIFLNKISEKIVNDNNEAIANNLGLLIEDIKNINPAIIEKEVNRRNSSDLLSNRISDFFGLVSTLLNWAGAAVQISILLICCWAVYEDGFIGAIYFWWLPASSIPLAAFSVFWLFLCRLLTGRYPGQAARARLAAKKRLTS